MKENYRWKDKEKRELCELKTKETGKNLRDRARIWKEKDKKKVIQEKGKGEI